MALRSARMCHWETATPPYPIQNASPRFLQTTQKAGSEELCGMLFWRWRVCEDEEFGQG